MSTHLRTGPGVLHSLLTIFTVFILRVRPARECIAHLVFVVLPLIIDIFRRSVKHCLTMSSPMQPLYSVLLCQASFRLGPAPRMPRQVLPNIFAASILMSTSTLTYAPSSKLCRSNTSSVPRHSRITPTTCRVKPHPACQHLNSQCNLGMF
ncbi:hypothetical protein DFJ58DRAFT_764104 [Suillus subalutaceus]|uniref:uncharacterized protein n=1 Tax=Suillus subalutaceus TaxID=48586 RepID=UPI001B85C8B7|nr:uncharacterized protein DFJ58DRAFT_764104 [Suillus subalutaceus]KAG1870679.1 hypothetical protein DFJ58DRAFT_764104 [Suillus subalutaceus]